MYQINVPSQANILFTSNEIKMCITLDCSIILGGDFNVTFDPELDGSEGIKKKTDFRFLAESFGARKKRGSRLFALCGSYVL